MTKTLFVPVGYAEAADRLAAMIERGALRVQSHWHSREACQAFIDRQPRLLHASYVPTAVMVRVAEEAGRDRPARTLKNSPLSEGRLLGSACVSEISHAA